MTNIARLVSLQPLTLPDKFVAFLFQLELLNLPARGLRVIVDPEDVFRYCKFLYQLHSGACLRLGTLV